MDCYESGLRLEIGNLKFTIFNWVFALGILLLLFLDLRPGITELYRPIKD